MRVPLGCHLVHSCGHSFTENAQDLDGIRQVSLVVGSRRRGSPEVAVVDELPDHMRGTQVAYPVHQYDSMTARLLGASLPGRDTPRNEFRAEALSLGHGIVLPEGNRPVHAGTRAQVADTGPRRTSPRYAPTSPRWSVP